VNAGKQGYTEAQPIANEDFSLFSQNKKEKTIFQDFPPLLAPLTVFQTGLLTEVLFYQKIGTVTTTNPLILFSRSTGRKTGIIAGENIWRWRIANYFQQSDHAAFDDLINKIIHFLAVKEDKDFFRIKIGTRLSENEPVEMEAELYNSSYELVNEPDVNVVITGQEQKNYPLTFSRSEHAYYLNAGILPVGNYTYVASVSLGKTNFQKRGSFFIEQINKEFFRLTADHQLLHRIAETHGGEMVYPADIEKIGDKINSRDDIRSVSIIEKKFTGLVGNPWLFILILALLSAEWIARKRKGL
jgi:hypothetical protein